MNAVDSLKALICEPVNDVQLVCESRWLDDGFYVWVRHTWIDEFIAALKNIFGYSLFDESGIMVNLQNDCICINLSELLYGHLSLVDVFDKE